MIQCPKCSAENSDDSRFCKSCGEELSSLSQAPTVAAPEGESPPSPVQSPHVGRIVSSDSVPAGGFTPGTILADRYRVIGLLGRGGMGEVYRADDLKLGQPVALKFLPPALAQDSVRRERFFAEVRITRQLSHPNICRVYDIGEVDGRHFLSMEYIDGEDLASLMKRIGHLSNEKALDIARQLMAGLAVAHERGVLHRDLKPANIMLDGHGRVRITDFGLAIAAEDEEQAEEIAGTPAYMAPEQLAGKGATVRSDIYSLGLILYEIYTGKKAFKAKTLAELREQKETQTPRAPSELRDGIDPVVERVIQRCMEIDPGSRPASVAQLAQALPGGDPLAAAIAAGETPSPEMVAASGSKEGLRPVVAWSILASIILGMLVLTVINDRTMLHRQIPFEKQPEVLIERSREIIKKAGYSEEFTDCASRFMVNSALLRYMDDLDSSADLKKNINSETILFMYRQSPRTIEPRVTGNLPPLENSGEVQVFLNTEGYLRALIAVPPQKVETNAQSAVEPDWNILLVEAGLDPSQWTPTDPQWSPLFFADTRAAWQGSLPRRPGTPIGIEAAAFQGRPVYFQVIGPWTRAAQMEPVRLKTSERIANVLSTVFPLAMLAVALFFAMRNLRLGRGDRRNATRLSLLVIGIAIGSWALSAHHIQTTWELDFFFWNFGISLFMGGALWILYIAIEPFVRRRWPQILVSWTRLLSGGLRDPLVARDALIGCSLGVLAFGGFRFAYDLIPSWLGIEKLVHPPLAFTLATVLGTNHLVATVLFEIRVTIVWNLAMVSVLFMLRILLRNQKIAIAASVLLMASVDSIGNYHAFVICLLFLYPLWYFALIRFGLIAGMLFMFLGRLFIQFPISLDLSEWYSDAGYMALAILVAIVLYAFRTSLGGRPMFGTSRLDD